MAAARAGSLCWSGVCGLSAFSRRQLTRRKCRALLEKHFGCVSAIAHELGISRQAVYDYLNRHPDLLQFQRELRDTLENDIPACAKANVARAILRESLHDDFPTASFKFLRQREGITVSGTITIVWDWNEDEPSQDE